jgi:hypothetical protein
MLRLPGRARVFILWRVDATPVYLPIPLFKTLAPNHIKSACERPDLVTYITASVEPRTDSSLLPSHRFNVSRSIAYDSVDPKVRVRQAISFVFSFFAVSQTSWDCLL